MRPNIESMNTHGKLIGNSEISAFQTIIRLTYEVRHVKSRWVYVEDYLIGH